MVKEDAKEDPKEDEDWEEMEEDSKEEPEVFNPPPAICDPVSRPGF